MEKLQILFPKPVLDRLRAHAKLEDRPVSEIVRRAVERHLSQLGAPESARTDWLSSFVADLGQMRVPVERLRDVIYAEEDEKILRHVRDSHEKPRYQHPRIRRKPKRP